MIKIVEKLDLSNSKPGQNKYNKQVFQKYKKYFDNISEFIYYYKDPIKAENERYCRTCGKKLKFKNNLNKYPLYCSCKCKSVNPQEIQKKLNTLQTKYGVSNVSQIQAVKDKKNLTKLNNIDSQGLNSYQRGAIRHKINCLNKYGVDNYSKTEQKKELYKNQEWVNATKEKEYKTRKEKYGRENYYNIEKKHNTCLAKYGIEEYSQTEEFQRRVYNTKTRNHSFNISKDEEDVFLLLSQKFKTIERQYKSKVYPFVCDFYIPIKDLYIECHFSQYHNGRPFKHSIEDMKQVEKFKQKAKELNFKGQYKKQYSNILETWTKRDVAKLKCFKENKLNYKIFYSKQQFSNWFKTI